MNCNEPSTIIIIVQEFLSLRMLRCSICFYCAPFYEPFSPSFHYCIISQSIYPRENNGCGVKVSRQSGSEREMTNNKY